MHDIEMSTVSEAFAQCWHAAGRHLQVQMQGSDQFWLKATLTPPFLEHLSFRLGNQLFFVRIEDEDGQLDPPGSRSGLESVSEGCRGHACLMLMRRRADGWSPTRPGWGLVDAHTGNSVNPAALVTDESIEMTDWEVHDLAVQVVRQHLTDAGRTLMSWTGDPRINPSIWFMGGHSPEWVVVRAVRYPTLEATVPANWPAIAESCSRLGRTGHFASVSVANADDAFDPSGSVRQRPLWRGHAMSIRFDGLAPLSQ